MTIEGRPELKGTEDFLNKTYAKQRKDRMQDAIDDYLQDDKVSARQTYEEIISCVNDVMEYHKTAYCRASGLSDLLHGYREVDPFIDDPKLVKKLQYDKIPQRY